MEVPREGFHDYTVVTQWERVIAYVEQHLRSWLFTGLDQISKGGGSGQGLSRSSLIKIQANLQSKLPWRWEPYWLTLHVPYMGIVGVQMRAAQRRQEQHQEGQLHLLPDEPDNRVPEDSKEVGRGPEVEGAGPAMDEMRPPAEVAEDPASTGAVEVEGGLDEGPTSPHMDSDGANSDVLSTSEDQLTTWLDDFDRTQMELMTSAHQETMSETSKTQDDGDEDEAAGPPSTSRTTPTTSSGSGVGGEEEVLLNLEGAGQLWNSDAVRVGPADKAVIQQNILRDREEGSAVWQWWPYCQSGSPWRQSGVRHKVQRWFGVDVFLTLVPRTYSGRILKEEEATTLLSACLVALNNVQVPWPVLIPVHDALRDGYWGAAQVADHTVKFFADSIHTSRLPTHLEYLEGQLEAFADQLYPCSPQAASTCMLLLEQLTGEVTGQQRENLPGGQAGQLSLRLNMCSTYLLPEPQSKKDGGASEDADSLTLWVDEWDSGCPWRPWATQQDPVAVLEVDLTWTEVVLVEEGVSVQGSPDLSPSAANQWTLHVLQQGYSHQPQMGLSLKALDRSRKYVTLNKEGVDWMWSANLGQMISSVGAAPSTSQPSEGAESFGPGSFTTMLSALLTARSIAGLASAISDLLEVEWWADKVDLVPPVPPGGVLQDVIRDLFAATQLPPVFQEGGLSAGIDVSARTSTEVVDEAWEGEWGDWEDDTLGPSNGQVPPGPGVHRHAPEQSGSGGSTRYVDEGGPGLKGRQSSSSSEIEERDGEARAPRLPRSASVESLTSRFALHAMCFGNARAVAMLWLRFVRELRFSYWELGTNLPRMGSRRGRKDQEGLLGERTGVQHGPGTLMPGPPPPDFSCCLLHQKLQMINFCIHRRGCNIPDPSASSPQKCTSRAKPRGHPEYERQVQPEGHAEGDLPSPEGVLSISADTGLLLRPEAPLRVPITQAPPVYTEDQVWMHQIVVQQLENAQDASARHEAKGKLVAGLLASDMSAFKAANPGCCFEDFVRWYCPQDWIPGESAGCSAEGGQLSVRMSDPNSFWRLAWQQAKPLSASSQRPLFDPVKEGELCLHYLETLHPQGLFNQLVGLAFNASFCLLEECESVKTMSCVADVVETFRRNASVILSKGGGLVEALCPPDRQGAVVADVNPMMAGSSAEEASGVPLPPSYDDAELEFLLSEFHYVEQVVVLAESLRLRLPNCPLICEAVMKNLLCGNVDDEEVAFRSAAKIEGLPDRWQLAEVFKRHEVSDRAVHDLEGRNPEDMGGTSAGVNTLDAHHWSDDPRSVLAPRDLGSAVHQEWVLTCGPGSNPEVVGHMPAVNLDSRMYVEKASGEVRVAYRLVNESGW